MTVCRYLNRKTLHLCQSDAYQFCCVTVGVGQEL